MNISGMQTNFANAVSPFNPLGKQAVGQEETDSKESTLKPVEQSPEAFRSEEKKESGDLIVNEKRSFSGDEDSDDESSGFENKDTEFAEQDLEKTARQQEAERTQLEQDQHVIRELAARDREVRNHERAHAAVGGQHAGAPTYTYQRGPDGISYAVGGEVPISTREVSGNPQATIEKAQQIRRAALAPAEPSPQDRRVAAKASQMEAEARQELVIAKQQQMAEEKAIRQEQAERSESKSTSSTSAASSQTAGNSPQPVNFTNRAAESRIGYSDKFAGGFVNTDA